MNLQEMIQKYIKNGYLNEFASSKVSQDLILTAIANSKYNQNITIKGGVVMHNLSNDKRRATMFDSSIINLGANLLINSPEQIFAEKMKSLLKFNIRSTKYKDIFDFYYLIDNKDVLI